MSKNSLVVGALLAALHGAAYSADCGPGISAAALQRLGESIQQGRKNLFEHQGVLGREMQLLSNSPSAFEKADLEQTRVGRAHEASGPVQDLLDRMTVLVQIRDLMVDKRDRYVVERYLSSHAAGLGKMSGHVQQYLTELQGKVSRPGIALDVSQLRDSIGAVSKVFGDCTAPTRARTK